METLEKNVKWQVSLSNGETIYEGKNDYAFIAGELSPWNRLIDYISQWGFGITSISLYTDSGKTFNIPSAGKSPKFHAFSTAEKPIGLNFFRKAGKDLQGSEDFEHYAVIEALFEEYKLQLWVSEADGNNCWAMVVGKK